MPHSGTCLCGKTKIEIAGDVYPDQVNNQRSAEYLSVLIVVYTTRACATALIVGKRVEVLSAPTFSRPKRTLRSPDPSRTTIAKRLVVIRVIDNFSSQCCAFNMVTNNFRPWQSLVSSVVIAGQPSPTNHPVLEKAKLSRLGSLHSMPTFLLRLRVCDSFLWGDNLLTEGCPDL
jgi:hypothetical protein